MISQEALAAMSVQEMAQAIEDHHKESNQLYEVLASKVSKKTDGLGFIKDDRVNVVEYWLKIAKEQRKILAMDFNLDGFEEAYICFKFMADWANKNGNLSISLKTARDMASRDCSTFCAIVRKAVQSRESDPVYALILEKEPNQRKVKAKKDEKTPPPATT